MTLASGELCVPAEEPEAARARLRWAVNVGAWEPLGGAEGQEWRFLTGLLPAEASAKVAKFVHLEDKKRALCSQLLQRAACERALGLSFEGVLLAHTKGRKPYLANAPASRAHAPNWNFNVSHEGSYVVLAAEPFCVCGVDVAAPGQLRRPGASAPAPMQQYVELFKRQFTSSETRRILAAGDEAAQQDCFRKIWSLKEAYVKARGDGLALELGRVEFALRGCAAAVRLDGVEQPHWSFTLQQLGPAEPGSGAHWVTVARCRPQDVVDSLGGFRATLQHHAGEEGWLRHLRATSPPFELLSVSDLVPARCADGYAHATGDS